MTSVGPATLPSPGLGPIIFSLSPFSPTHLPHSGPHTRSSPAQGLPRLLVILRGKAGAVPGLGTHAWLGSPQGLCTCYGTLVSPSLVLCQAQLQTF